MRFYLIHDPNLLIKLKKHLNGTYVQEINEMLSNIETQKIDKYIDQKRILQFLRILMLKDWHWY
ncbi:hypothetical protein FM130_13205 [Enterococcus faecium]|nr:hypothetical protein FM130_13205 [Enterococcus faecium]